MVEPAGIVPLAIVCVTQLLELLVIWKSPEKEPHFTAPPPALKLPPLDDQLLVPLSKLGLRTKLPAQVHWAWISCIAKMLKNANNKALSAVPRDFPDIFLVFFSVCKVLHISCITFWLENRIIYVGSKCDNDCICFSPSYFTTSLRCRRNCVCHII